VVHVDLRPRYLPPEESWPKRQRALNGRWILLKPVRRVALLHAVHLARQQDDASLRTLIVCADITDRNAMEGRK
jgi:hypothetical protein